MKNILIVMGLMVVTFFTACGGGGSSDGGTTTPPPTSNSVSMIIDQAYTISTGQSIVKESEPTEIVLETDINSGTTQATLISGDASIVTN